MADHDIGVAEARAVRFQYEIEYSICVKEGIYQALGGAQDFRRALTWVATHLVVDHDIKMAETSGAMVEYDIEYGTT